MESTIWLAKHVLNQRSNFHLKSYTPVIYCCLIGGYFFFIFFIRLFAVPFCFVLFSIKSYFTTEPYYIRLVYIAHYIRCVRTVNCVGPSFIIHFDKSGSVSLRRCDTWSIHFSCIINFCRGKIAYYYFIMRLASHTLFNQKYADAQ